MTPTPETKFAAVMETAKRLAVSADKHYDMLSKAFDHFNKALWGGSLPPVMITLVRKKGAAGYFSPDRFRARQNSKTVHEIALNPETCMRPEKEVLSTLVHEMAHHWQQQKGSPSRGGYHNAEWAAEMMRIGLFPSSTGLKGGKTTGPRMSHYIVEDGPFEKAYADLQNAGIFCDWYALTPSVKPPKPKSKVKYACPHCELNAWAKPNLKIECGDCKSRLDEEKD